MWHHLCRDELVGRGVSEVGEWYGVRDGMSQLVEGEMGTMCSSDAEDRHIFPVSPSPGEQQYLTPASVPAGEVRDGEDVFS